MNIVNEVTWIYKLGEQPLEKNVLRGLIDKIEKTQKMTLSDAIQSLNIISLANNFDTNTKHVENKLVDKITQLIEIERPSQLDCINLVQTIDTLNIHNTQILQILEPYILSVRFYLAYSRD